MIRNDGEKYLSAVQIAEQLGLKPVTIRQWISKRKLASVKVGDRAIRVPASEIEKLIEQGFVPAAPKRAPR